MIYTLEFHEQLLQIEPALTNEQLSTTTRLARRIYEQQERLAKRPCLYLLPALTAAIRDVLHGTSTEIDAMFARAAQ